MRYSSQSSGLIFCIGIWVEHTFGCPREARQFFSFSYWLSYQEQNYSERNPQHCTFPLIIIRSHVSPVTPDKPGTIRFSCQQGQHTSWINTTDIQFLKLQLLLLCPRTEAQYTSGLHLTTFSHIPINQPRWCHCVPGTLPTFSIFILVHIEMILYQRHNSCDYLMV